MTIQYDKEQLENAGALWKMFEGKEADLRTAGYLPALRPAMGELDAREKSILRQINTRQYRGRVYCPECGKIQFVGIKYVSPYKVNNRWVKMAEALCQSCGEVLKFWQGYIYEKEDGDLLGRAIRARQRKKKPRKTKEEKQIPRFD